MMLLQFKHSQSKLEPLLNQSVVPTSLISLLFSSSMESARNFIVLTANIIATVLYVYIHYNHDCAHTKHCRVTTVSIM